MKRSDSLPTADPRMSAFVVMAALAQGCPRSLIERTLAACNVSGLRERTLPPWAVVYCVMSFGLWPQASSDAVLNAVAEGLNILTGDKAPSLQAGKSALSQARQRLGDDALRQLAQQVLQPLAAPGQVGAWYRSWRVLTLHEKLLAVPDSAANAAYFGRPAARGTKAAPAVRLLTLAEGLTLAPVAAAAGPSREDRVMQVKAFLAQQRPAGVLLLADAQFDSTDVLLLALAGSEPVLWQIAAQQRPDIDQMLPDGSYLGRGPGGKGVRVIGYTLQEQGAKPHDASFLLTNLRDPALAPALDLVTLFNQTMVRRPPDAAPKAGPSAGLAAGALRSKSPQMVMQEVWAMLLTEHALRRLGSLALLAQ